MLNYFNQIKNSLCRPLPKKLKQGEFTLHLHQFDLPIQYQLKTSEKRRTIALELKNAQITVRAPVWLRQEDVESFILSKQNWLLQKIKNQRHVFSDICQYQDGDKLLIQGHWMKLILSESTQFGFDFNLDGQQLILYIPKRVKQRREYIKKKLHLIYLQLAEQLIRPRFKQLEQKIDLTATSLEFKRYKSRWGCCYGSGLIRINPMIIGAPEWVIDCVLIHELCHLQHMNHSKSFWRLNQQHCDHCQQSKMWLKEHSLYLHLD